ncbi:MAG TPA: ATP-dependent DNA ligase [Allosphingosinicella sp.]
MPAFANLPLRPTIPPMEAKLVEALPEGEGWHHEPKWDGFRVLVFRDGEDVELQSKAEKPLGRYFPELVEAVRAIPRERFVVDGEMVIPVNGELSFDALQMRLHPAESRIRKLARDTPARIILFDCLALDDRPLVAEPLGTRRQALEEFHGAAGGDLMLSPYTRDRAVAEGWLAGSGVALDGVIAKRADAPYSPGERTMLKVKRLRTADCVVGGFRYATGKREVGSLLLGLYDDQGKLNHVGFTSAIPAAERPALTRRLEALVEAPGFTGSAPGGPSRWSTERSTEWQPLRPELVVEVRFDHAGANRFRHGTGFLRWRPDKAPRQCRMEQLYSPTPLAAIGDLGGGA